ncbi:MAG: hypothetical protein Q7S92_05975 [Candidatus Diapherotrites archaeon]|nr:hypothetical protein [Candidatus Diapherotrites archaeon]
MKVSSFLIVGILLVLVTSACLQPPAEEKVQDQYEIYDSTINQEETVPLQEGYPSGPLTTIEFNQNEIVFAHEASVYHIPFWKSAPFRDQEEVFSINGKAFDLNVFEKGTENQRFELRSENPTQDPEVFLQNPDLLAASQQFTYNTLGTSIALDTTTNIDEGQTLEKINYYPYVYKPESISEPTIIIEDTLPEDDLLFEDERFYLLLKSQTFEAQFGKKVKFTGTDKLENKQSTTDYYYPDYTHFKEDETDEKYLIGKFEIDEDGDDVYDITVYVDTYTDYPINAQEIQLPNYQYFVEYDNGKGLSELKNQEVHTQYGTRIFMTYNLLRIQIPQ